MYSDYFIRFLIKLAIILFISLICSLEDLKTQKVSLWKIILGFSFMMIYNIIFHRTKIFSIILDGFFIFLFFFLVKLIMKNKLGWGDVYFSVFLGIALPFYYSIISILLACGSCFIYYVIKKNSKSSFVRNKKISFIPFLSFGLIMSFLLFFSL